MRKIKRTNLKIIGSFIVLLFLFTSIAIIVKYLPQQRPTRPRAATQTVSFSGVSTDGHLYKNDTFYPPNSCTSYPGIDWVGQYAYLPSSTTYYEIERSYVGFDTSAIPDTATVTGASLKLKVQDNRTDTDFTFLVMRGNWGGSLSCSDWGVGTVQDGIRGTADLPPAGSYFEIPVSASGINKTGSTYYELKTSREGTMPCCVDYTHVYANELVRFYAGSNSVLDVTYTTPDPQPTVTLKANGVDGAITVDYNTPVTLSWTTTYADSCTASGDWSGSKSTSNSELMGNLTSNKTYTLTCTGAGGSNFDTVTVNVRPFVDLKVNSSDGPITVDYNTPVTLAWSVAYATSCIASGDWTGSKSPSGGSESTGNLTSNKTYTLTCTGAGGSKADAVVVNVRPSVDIKANGSDSPVTVSHNSSVNLSWTTSYATSCTASDNWSGSKATGGGETVGPLSGPNTYLYTLTCTGAGGSRFDNVTVIVNPLSPPTADIKANGLDGSIKIPYNNAAMISWTSSYATSCTVLETGWTGLQNTGISTGNLKTNRTYTLSCTGADGSSKEDSVTVNIAVAGDFNVDGFVNMTDFVKLAWYWGQNYPPCDTDGDNIVDMEDFVAMAWNWTGN